MTQEQIRIAQVTIANGCNQAEKANQRVQLSYPAYEWVMIHKHYMSESYGLRVAFDYEIARHPFAIVKNSQRNLHLSKTTDYPESFSLN